MSLPDFGKSQPISRRNRSRRKRRLNAHDGLAFS